MTSEYALFHLSKDSSRKRSDEAYTPRWIFDAMGLEFDLDVAAPVGGPWHVPTKSYYTVADDGLTSPWDGLVWCNPPYSGMSPWVDRYVTHDRAVLMGLALNRCQWLARAIEASDAVALLGNVGFSAPDGAPPPSFRQVVFVAFRGVGVGPAERLAAADPYGSMLYGKGSERNLRPRLAQMADAWEAQWGTGVIRADVAAAAIRAVLP